MIEVTMPRLSESMTEGKLLLWNVSVGDEVARGEQLAEIEADKANMEIESPVSGIVFELNGKPGDKMTVGTVMIRIRETDEKSSVATREPNRVIGESPVEQESPLDKRLKQFESKS